MLLKSLEIHGFKSFPDKTVLTFDNGITAVVGPNGSGKSNISDAIRWVLGEQSSKSLRGSKMEDVIFSGTSQRKGMGFAEVSLTIDNSSHKLDFEADEVKVTRRYYRSGDSEYKINNTTVRLKDVQLLFMDTGLGRDGYSIIGQGRIGDIVGSKSEERREIFEEAAGIAKYRYRKTEAERRLNAAEENLLRLRDIVTELEERVGPLKIQSEKAKKFLEYAGEKKELEIGLWLKRLDQSRDALRELNAKLELARTQYDNADEVLDDVENQIQQIATRSQQISVQIEEIRGKIHEAEETSARFQSDQAVLHNDIRHNEENIQRLENETQQSADGGKLVQQDIARNEQLIAEQQAAADAAEQQRGQIEHELETLTSSSQEAAGKMQELSEKASAAAVQLSEMRVRKVTAESLMAEIDGQMEQMTSAVKLSEEQNSQLQKDVEECKQAGDVIAEHIESLQNTLKGYQFRFDSRRKRLEEKKQAVDKAVLDASEKHRRAQLLEDLERNLEGFNQSVKLVMKQVERHTLNGICGPVSVLINATAEYALAVETALGASTQSIVCQTEGDAKQAIQFLKSGNGGRATFLPLTTIKGNPLNESGLRNETGFIGMACDLVTYEPQYEQIARNLLGRTAVAEDMDCAVAIARKYHYRFRIVTLDGQVVNAGGSMTGGSHIRNAGLLSRRTEIDALIQKAAELDEKAVELKNGLKTMQEEVSASQAEMLGTQGELTTAQEDRIRCESEFKRLSEQLAAGKQACEQTKLSMERQQKRRQECLDAVATADSQTAELNQQKDEIEAELSKISGGQSEVSAKREQLSTSLSDIKLTVLAHTKEIEAKTAVIDGLRGRLENDAAYREQLAAQIAELKQNSTELEEKCRTMQQQSEDCKSQVENYHTLLKQLAASRSEGEAEQTRLRQQSRDKSDERENAGREVARIEEKCAAANKESDDLTRRLYEEYELTRSEAEAVAKPIENLAEASRRLNELKNKIRGLGSVNVEAIDEYRQVSERYEFLSAQVADVEKSKAELTKLIDELTVQMKDIFIERFRQINEHYGVIFQEMFGGGKGELKLTDPNDILHSGIEMSVQPPGKVILNLDALSGGEKALVAIVLLFAILKVTPSPFCVLDEIEAALDDVNVDRYAAYLRRMCDHTQFIVITHRRGTMEEADVLYGVTMQERGVSKLLELRASEVEEKLGITGAKEG